MRIRVSSVFRFFFFVFLCGLNAHTNTGGIIALIFRQGAMMGLVISGGLEAVMNAKEGRLSLRNVYFVRFLTLVLVYYLSIIWSRNTDDVMYSAYISYFLQILIISFFLEIDIGNNGHVEEYLNILFFSVLYLVFVLAINTPLRSWGTERVGDVVGLNSNDVGIRMAYAIVIAIFFSKKKKWYGFAIIPLAIIAMLSGSRKALFMMLIGFSAFMIGENRGNKRVRNIMVAVATVLFVLYLVMNNPVMYQVLGKRVENMFTSMTGVGRIRNETSIVEREFYRTTAYGMFADKPLLGWGANSFVTRMREINYSHVAYSHCNYTELLATLGIVGFTLYYRIELGTFFNSFSRYRKAHKREDLFILAFLLTNLFGEYFFVSYVSVFTQIMICILVNFSTEQEELHNL